MELLKNIFDSDVMDKTINPVIKVSDNKDIITEIQDYVVTDEIEEHLKRFFDAYFNNSAPDTCVYISGFFGSGKSHFMKILGYLLQNQNYQGIEVAKTIAGKIKNNALLAADIKDKLAKQNNKIIMFSMTDVSSHDKSLLETIYSQIMISFGYSESIELARYELSMTLEGKYEEFKKKVFEEERETWESFRDIKLNNRNRVLSKIIPELYPDVYKNGFQLSDVFMDLSITSDKVADLIKTFLGIHSEYNNIIIMIDEIGQYVGNDEEKMSNLQGVAESIDRTRKELKNHGIWFVVTAQQKLQDMIEDFDANSKTKFTRISHRFSTRIDLRSEDIDRVIKDRVLRKKEDYKGILSKYYDDNGGAITANLKIENTRNMLIGDTQVLIESYPFLNYHFSIARDLLQSMMGPDKKHVNYGERNMIRLTQNVLKNSMREMKIGEFCTLDFIFDAVKQDIENDIRLDIERKIPDVFDGYANKGLYVRTAKALFVLDRVKYIGNTIKNIATCLTNNPLSPVSESDIKTVLNDLIDKGFVGKTSEGGYKLLSIKEKKIEEIIKETHIRRPDVDRKRLGIIEDLLKDTKAGIRYKGAKFDINLFVDNEEKSKGGYIRLEVFSSEEPQVLISMDINQNTVKWYTTDQTEINNMITRMLKLEKAIADMKDSSDDAIAIKREKQVELEQLTRDIPNKIEDSLKDGKIIYCGSDYKPKDYGSMVKNIAEKFFTEEPIPKVFNKFDDGAVNIQPADYKKYIQDVILVDRPKGSYPDLCELGVMEDRAIKLSGAVCDALYNYILSKNKWKETVYGSVILEDYAKPPYGWAQNVIKLVIAAMVRLGKVEIHSEGVRYDNYSQTKIKDIFLKDTLFKDIRIVPVIEADAAARLIAKNRLSTLFGKYAIDTVEDLSRKVKEVCDDEVSKINSIINQVKYIEFPEEIINKLTEQGRIYEKIGLAGDNQRINDFIKISEEEMQQMFNKVKSVSEFIGSKIEEYKEVRQELNSIRRFGAYLSGDEKLNFESQLNEIAIKVTEDDFIDSWKDIYEKYLKLKGKVNGLYIGIHNQCNSAYEKEIQSINDMIYAHRDKISDDMAKELLAPLTNKLCENIDKINKYRCHKCGRDLQVVKDDIEILETLKQGIVSKIEKYINPSKQPVDPPMPPTNKNEVTIMQVINNTQKKVIKNKDDMDEFIEEIKLKIEMQLNNGKNIVIKQGWQK